MHHFFHEISFCADLCACWLAAISTQWTHGIHLGSWMALILLSHTALCHPVHLSSLTSSFQILTCLHFWSAQLLITLGWSGRVQVGCCCQVLDRANGCGGMDVSIFAESIIGWKKSRYFETQFIFRRVITDDWLGVVMYRRFTLNNKSRSPAILAGVMEITITQKRNT